jgi:predicted RNA-binding Zn ribbon-like protein
MNDTSKQTSRASQPDAGPFLFLSDLLALDLVNTQIVARGKPRDLLATPADVAHWWAAARRQHPGMPAVQNGHALRLDDPATLDELKRLRAALRRIFSALADGLAPPPEAVDGLNAVLRTGHPALELTPSGEVRAVYGTLDPAYGPLLLPIALSALAWLTAGDRRRLHRCANQRCVLLFYDTTRSATRRWCSVGCMDRARSARRYRQAKGEVLDT